MKHTVYSATAGGCSSECPAIRLRKKFEQYQRRRKDFGLYLTDSSSMLDRLYLNDPALRSLRLTVSLVTAKPSAANARRVDAAVEEAKALCDALCALAEREAAEIAAEVEAANEALHIAKEKAEEENQNNDGAAALPSPLPAVLHPLQLKPFTSYTGGVAYRLQAAAEEERQRLLREAEEQAMACGGGSGGGMSVEKKDERVPLPPIPRLPPPPPLVVSEALLFHDNLRSLEITPEVLQVLHAKDVGSISSFFSTTPTREITGKEKERFSWSRVGGEGIPDPRQYGGRNTKGGGAGNRGILGRATEGFMVGGPERTKDDFHHQLEVPEDTTSADHHPRTCVAASRAISSNGAQSPSYRLYHWSRLMQSLYHLPLQALILADLHLTPGELEHTLLLVKHLSGVETVHRKSQKEPPSSYIAPNPSSSLLSSASEGGVIPGVLGTRLDPNPSGKDYAKRPEEPKNVPEGGKGGGKLLGKNDNYSQLTGDDFSPVDISYARKGTLKYLDLRRTAIPPYLAEELGRLLFHPNSSLVRVELEGCSIGDEGARALFSFFPFFAHQLQYNSTSFGPRRGRGAQSFPLPPYKLRVLGLQWNQLTAATERLMLSSLPPLPGEAYGDNVDWFKDADEGGGENVIVHRQTGEGESYVAEEMEASETDKVDGKQEKGKISPLIESKDNSLLLPYSRSTTVPDKYAIESCSFVDNDTEEREEELFYFFDTSLFLYLEGNHLSSQGNGLWKKYLQLFQASRQFRYRLEERSESAESRSTGDRGTRPGCEPKQCITGGRQRARTTVVPVLPAVPLNILAEEALAASIKADQTRLGRWRGEEGNGSFSLVQYMLNGVEEQLRHLDTPQAVSYRKKKWRRERRAARAIAEGAAAANEKKESTGRGPVPIHSTKGTGEGVSSCPPPSSFHSYPLMEPWYCLRVIARMVDRPSLGGSPYALVNPTPTNELNQKAS